MLFVDFPDAPGTGSLDALYHRFGDATQTWFSQVSAGRLRFTVTPLLQWLHMPQPSGAYNVSRLGDYAAYTAYLRQAVQLADPTVDFHGYDVVYVVASSHSRIGTGPAWIGPPGQPLASVDGVTIREAAGEPADLLTLPGDRGYVFAHETGHMLGLPDLYDYNGYGFLGQFAFVGFWDLMGGDSGGSGLFGWERWQLGWIDASQIRCLSPGKSLATTLTPLEQPGATKLVVIATSPTTASVIEDRQAIAEDAGLCYSGVLVYQVDTAIHSGNGPIRVTPAHPDTGVDENRCGPLARAPINPGETFTDPTSRATITVDPGDPGATLQLHLTRGTP